MIGFEVFVKEFLNKNNLTLKYADGKELSTPDYGKFLDILLKGALSYAVTNDSFTLKDSFVFNSDGTIEVKEKLKKPIKNLQGKLITDGEQFLEEILGTNITRIVQ